MKTTVYSMDLKVRFRKNPELLIEQLLENHGFDVLVCDGFVDPEDAFPENIFQWADQDGDGYGDEVDRPGGDDCLTEYGKSLEMNRFGCPDLDGDGWADVDDAFPNEVILVLDATTGQNALNQVEEFSKIHKLTGLIITKLDSTAKGGVVLAICKKYKLPIVAVGMGEKEDDLQPFKAEYFSKALLGIES